VNALLKQLQDVCRSVAMIWVCFAEVVLSTPDNGMTESIETDDPFQDPTVLWLHQWNPGATVCQWNPGATVVI
jgi:hypothetical protein